MARCSKMKFWQWVMEAYFIYSIGRDSSFECLSWRTTNLWRERWWWKNQAMTTTTTTIKTTTTTSFSNHPPHFVIYYKIYALEAFLLGTIVLHHPIVRALLEWSELAKLAWMLPPPPFSSSLWLTNHIQENDCHCSMTKSLLFACSIFLEMQKLLETIPLPSAEEKRKEGVHFKPGEIPFVLDYWICGCCCCCYCCNTVCAIVVVVRRHLVTDPFQNFINIILALLRTALGHRNLFQLPNRTPSPPQKSSTGPFQIQSRSLSISFARSSVICPGFIDSIWSIFLKLGTDSFSGTIPLLYIPFSALAMSQGWYDIFMKE